MSALALPSPVEILPPGAGQVEVWAAPHPFKSATLHRHFEAGTSLQEMVEEVQPRPELRLYAHVTIDGHAIAQDLWPRVRPKPDTLVNIRMWPTGGSFGGGGGGGGKKNALSFVIAFATIALSIAFPAAAPFIQLGSALLTGVIGFLSPQPKPKLPVLSGGLSGGGTASRDSPTTFLTGSRNDARPFGVVPESLGEHRMTAPLGALTFTEVEGDDQYLRILLVWSADRHEVTDLTIKETPIDQFEGVEIEQREGTAADAPLTLITDDPFEEVLDILLENSTGWHTVTSQLNADELSVDITFPRGLVGFADDGDKRDITVQVDVQYSPAGAGIWSSAGSITATARRTSAVRRSLRWTVAQGQYDVRLQRVTADSSSTKIIDEVRWTALRSISAVDPIQAPYPVCKTALRIKATGQFRVVDELRAVVKSIVPDWDQPTQTWIERTTRNPASLFRHVLQGASNARPSSDAEIDLDQLAVWHDFNVLHGFTFDMVIDFASTVGAVLDEICAAGRARKDIRDGKWTVVIDEAKTVPVQVFTPDNAWSFRGEKGFEELPHAFRARFINRDQGYRQDERFIYRDGFDENNATRIVGIEFPGNTNPDRIWQEGRWRFAEMVARPEGYTWFADIEHLVARVGDMVVLNHDIISVGLGSGRIKALITDAGNTTGVLLDAPVEMEAGKSYRLRIRLEDGAQFLGAVVTDPGEQAQLDFVTPIATADGPQEGDLFAFGEVGLEALEVIITALEPGEELSARITAHPAANHIHDSDLETIPPHVTALSTPVLLSVPVITTVRSDGSVLVTEPDGTFSTRILVGFRQPSALQSEIIGVEARFRVVGSDGPHEFIPMVPGDAGEISIAPADKDETYELQLRYVISDGTRGDWGPALQHLVEGRADKPPAPETFEVEEQPDGTRVFSWTMAAEPADVRASGGYRLFKYLGVTADLNDMTQFGPALVPGFSLEINEPPAAGQWTLAIVTVDSLGELSDPTFQQSTLGDPRLREVLLFRFEEQEGWPGTLTDCYRYGTTLRATGAGSIADLPATISALPATIVGMVARNTPITYRTPELPIGAVTTFVPRLTVTANGTVTLRERHGDTSPLSGAFAALTNDEITAAYIQFEVEVDDPSSPVLNTLKILIDGESRNWIKGNIDPVTETAGWFEKIAAGHYKFAPDQLSAISQGQLNLQSLTAPGWDWTMSDRNADIGGELAAEFKVWNPAGSLADPPSLDVIITGPRS